MNELTATIALVRADILAGVYDEFYAQIVTEACDECEIFVIKNTVTR